MDPHEYGSESFQSRLSAIEQGHAPQPGFGVLTLRSRAVVARVSMAIPGRSALSTLISKIAWRRARSAA